MAVALHADVVNLQTCLMRATEALTLLVRDMKAHATSTAAFLHPVQCNKKFVSTGSALRSNGVRRRKQLRRLCRLQYVVNTDIGKKLTTWSCFVLFCFRKKARHSEAR